MNEVEIFKVSQIIKFFLITDIREKTVFLVSLHKILHFLVMGTDMQRVCSQRCKGGNIIAS